jgi:hypothetical protein
VSDPVQATPGPGQGEDSSRALSALAGTRGCDAQCGLKAHAIQPFNDGSQGKVPLVMPPVPRTVGYPCRSSSVIAPAFAAEKALHQPRLSEGHRADGGNAIRKRLRPGRACRERGRGKHSDCRRKVSGRTAGTLRASQIIDDSRNVGWPDRRLVGLDHLVRLGVPGGFRQRRLVVHEPDARPTSLITLAYLSCLRSQGSRIGGGRRCLFVIIPHVHGTSRMMFLKHVRSLTPVR